jgi:hypothetical protein
MGDAFANRLLSTAKRTYFDSALSFVFQNSFNGKEVNTKAVVVCS